MSLGFVLSFLIAFVLSFFPVFRSVSEIREGGTLGRREVVSEIIPLGITVAVVQYFTTIIYSVDRLIIGFMAGPSGSSSLIAVYSMATTLGLVLMVFPASIGGIFLPVVSRLAGSKDLAGVREVMATAQRWSLFITLPVAVVMMAFAPEMLAVFYGSEYVAGAAVMAMFTFGLVFSAFSYTASLALTAMRLVRLELYIAVACGTANLLLNIALIPQFGIEGAAAASAASFILSALMMGHYARKALGFSTPPGAYRLLAAAALVFAAATLARPAASAALSAVVEQAGAGELSSKVAFLAYLGALIAASFALFVAMALLLRCLRAEDISLGGRALRKAGVPPSLAALAEKVAAYGVHSKE
jgi:O-antigen/teichoic acid export membrane protein